VYIGDNPGIRSTRPAKTMPPPRTIATADAHARMFAEKTLYVLAKIKTLNHLLCA
jgi:hypothetical protein